MAVTAADTHSTINAIFHIERPKLIAGLARVTRNVGTAEDLAQEALISALEQWPTEGVPDNPGAWLMTVGKRRAIDNLRRDKLLDRKHEELGAELAEEQASGHAMSRVEEALDNDVDDDLLRLIFTACHPLLTPESRVALTLRLLGGLTTDEIARAFLISEQTVAQRIVRAKRTLAEAAVPFEVPRSAERAARLASVLEVIYLIFNEGYSATRGDDLLRPALCEEALRLGRVLAELVSESEVHGLVALMEIQSSRARARTKSDGTPVLLLEQNRALWDQLLIRRGLAALDRAEKMQAKPGAYVLQAAIAACHARASTAEATDWLKIAALYATLLQVSPSPIVELNHAVAVSMAFGPAQGLQLVDDLREEPALANYYLLAAVRGDLLFKLARYDEARSEFQRAASQTQNSREREFLLGRGEECEART